MLLKLWNDEDGFVTLEYLLGATILVMGMGAGMSAIRDTVNSEFNAVSQDIAIPRQNLKSRQIKLPATNVSKPQEVSFAIPGTQADYQICP
jgi:Flp pilus assembly pilin Flp